MSTAKRSAAAMLIAMGTYSMVAYAQTQAPADTGRAATGNAQSTASAHVPKTREEVKEELARAKASGEYDALTAIYRDPFAVRQPDIGRR